MADTQRCFELLGKGDADGLRCLIEESPGTAAATTPVTYVLDSNINWINHCD